MTKQDELLQVLDVHKAEFEEQYVKLRKKLLALCQDEIDNVSPSLLARLFMAAYGDLIWRYCKPMGTSFEAYRADVDRLKKKLW